MKNKYREKFLSNLTDTVCDYLKGMQAEKF